MTTYALAALFEKRAELAGQIIQAEKHARQLRDDLPHVEAVIRILQPGIELEKGGAAPRRVPVPLLQARRANPDGSRLHARACWQ